MVKEDATDVVSHLDSKNAGIVRERDIQSYSWCSIALVLGVKVGGRFINALFRCTTSGRCSTSRQNLINELLEPQVPLSDNLITKHAKIAMVQVWYRHMGGRHSWNVLYVVGWEILPKWSCLIWNRLTNHSNRQRGCAPLHQIHTWIGLTFCVWVQELSYLC